MGTIEIQQFLNDLSTTQNLSSTSVNQALNAIMFLYKRVLELEVGDLNLIRPKKLPKSLPVVFSQMEAMSIIKKLAGQNRLMAAILFGSGLRLNECVQLRIKDLDFSYQSIHVRQGKERQNYCATFETYRSAKEAH